MRLGELSAFAWDMRLTLTCLQGIVNRSQPGLYLVHDGYDEMWLDRLREPGARRKAYGWAHDGSTKLATTSLHHKIRLHGAAMRTGPRKQDCLRAGLLLVPAFVAQLVFGAPRLSPAEAREHAERGMKFVKLNDLKAAEAEFRQAIELSPDNADYLAELGSILGMERKLEESTSYLKKALALDPQSTSVRRNLASNQWQMGQYEETSDNLKRILAVKPGDPRTVLLLGMVSEGLKQYREAVRLLESVPTLVKEQPESIAALGRAYYHMGQKEQGRRTLNGLLGHGSGDRGLFVGAKAAADSGDYEMAERLFHSMQSAYPDASTLGYQVALVQYRAGRFDQCQRTLAELPKVGGQGVDLYNLLALCYHRQGKEAEAIQTLDESLERISHTELDYLNLTNMLLNNRLLAAAHKTAKSAVAMAPNSARAFTLKGTVELELYYYKDAIQSFSRTLELDPSCAEADLGLALAQWGAGKIAEATGTFEEGLKRFPRDARHYTRYARLLIEASEQNADSEMESHAVALLQKAISVDPSLADPHYELGNLLLSKGRTQEAVTELETASKLDANTSSIRYSLARAYRRLGRNEDASKAIEEYNKLKAEDDSKL